MIHGDADPKTTSLELKIRTCNLERDITFCDLVGAKGRKAKVLYNLPAFFCEIFNRVHVSFQNWQSPAARHRAQDPSDREREPARPITDNVRTNTAEQHHHLSARDEQLHSAPEESGDAASAADPLADTSVDPRRTGRQRLLRCAQFESERLRLHSTERPPST